MRLGVSVEKTLDYCLECTTPHLAMILGVCDEESVLVQEKNIHAYTGFKEQTCLPIYFSNQNTPK